MRRTFTAVDSFLVTDRGRCFSGMVQPDPPVQLGEEVSIVVQPEGEPYPVEIVTGKVKGVAAFASIQGRDPGQPIGILLSEEDAVRERSKHVL